MLWTIGLITLMVMPVPGLLRLRKAGVGLESRILVLDTARIQTIEDLVQHCTEKQWRGWELVEKAQWIVARKFDVYSTINFWDTPRRAFKVGMGYCAQYNVALALVLKGVKDNGIDEVKVVSSLKVSLRSDPTWSMGHTWLKVRIGNTDIRDVCAGSVRNRPGVVDFVPVWRTFNSSPYSLLLLLHAGFCGFSAVVETLSMLSLIRTPKWSYYWKD